MRLASILTPNGARVCVATADGYVDLHATDPGLPTCIKHLLAASPGDPQGRRRGRRVRRGR